MAPPAVSLVGKTAKQQGDVKFWEREVFGFEFGCTPKKFGPRKLSSRIDFLELLVNLWPGNWQNQLGLDDRIREANDLLGPARRAMSMKQINPSEF